VHLRVRLLRPTRRLPHGPSSPHDASSHGRTPRVAVNRGGRPGDGCARFGDPGRRRVRQGFGIPFGYGLVKNRYIGRTFIAPDQGTRAASVRRKFNPLRENIEGQRLVVVDDSIVRGTTTKALVTMLRDAGAKEVHFRISSPPFISPCYYGIDTPNRDELLAANNSIEEMNAFIGSDSLEYITLANLRSAIQLDGECCDACLTVRIRRRFQSPSARWVVAGESTARGRRCENLRRRRSID